MPRASGEGRPAGFHHVRTLRLGRLESSESLTADGAVHPGVIQSLLRTR